VRVQLGNRPQLSWRKRELFQPSLPTLSLQSLTDFGPALPFLLLHHSCVDWLSGTLAQLCSGPTRFSLPSAARLWEQISLMKEMNPPHCGYFSSFPLVHLQEPVVAPGNRSHNLAEVLTGERPKSLLF